MVTSPRAGHKTLLPLLTDNPDTDERLRTIERAIRQLQEGALGIAIFTGSVTLGQSTTTTQVSDIRLTASSRIFLMPTTAHAASIDSMDLYVSTKAAGSFTLTHDSNSSTTRTFDWLAVNP